MFEWWCSDTQGHQETPVCEHWRWFTAAPRNVSPEAAEEYKKTAMGAAPTEAEATAINEAYCGADAHAEVEMCKNSPYTKAAKKRLAKQNQDSP